MPATRLEQVIVWASGAVIVGAVALVVAAGQGLRANFGAQRSTLGISLAFAAVVLVLHAGYLLGPLWLSTGRRGLGLALMLPPALLAAAALFIVLRTEVLPDLLKSGGIVPAATIAGGVILLGAYAGPLIVMGAALFR
jgi:hypothetical protein